MNRIPKRLINIHCAMDIMGIGNAEELAGFIYAYYFDPDKLEDASITGNVNMAD